MALSDFARVPLLFGPSPVHRLERLSAHLGGRVELWVAGFADQERQRRVLGIDGSATVEAHLGGQPALNGYAGAF